MARTRSSGGHEGTQSTLMTDANKCVCDRCGGTEFHINVELDANTDLPPTADCYIVLGSNVGGIAMNVLKMQCVQCGLDQGRAVLIIDKIKDVTVKALTMEHLDCKSVVSGGTGADNLAGYYCVITDTSSPTDAWKYMTIVSNTEASPTVITVSETPNADADEEYIIIMNFKPAALTVNP